MKDMAEAIIIVGLFASMAGCTAFETYAISKVKIACIEQHLQWEGGKCEVPTRKMEK